MIRFQSRATRFPFPLCLALFLIAASPTQAQECDLGVVKLRTQSDVDAFQQTYREGGPPCTTVIGELVVEQAPGVLLPPEEQITSLEGLREVREVQGVFAVAGNPQLTSLQGLELLERASRVRIAHNRALASTVALTGLRDVSILQIDHNRSLVNLGPFSSLRQVFFIRVNNNRLLEDVDFLTGLRGAHPELRIDIAFNPALKSLAGLSGIDVLDTLAIEENRSLSDLGGLEGLVGIRRGLALWRNAALEDISALSGVSGTLDALSIIGSPGLANFDALTGVTRVDTIFLQGLAGLENIDGLENLRGKVSSLFLLNLPRLESIDPLAGISGSRVNLIIRDNDRLRDLDALAGISSARELQILNNDMLEHVDGLRGLREAQRLVVVQNNARLQNLDGLSSLGTIVWVSVSDPSLPSSALIVTDNPSLTDCAGLGPLLGYPTIPFDAQAARNRGVRQLNLGDGNGAGARQPDDCLASYAERLPPTLPDFDLAVHGSWYDPSTPGEGLMMFTAPNNTISLYYYGYDENGSPAWWVAGSRRTGAWNERINLEVFDTSGGSFTDFDPDRVALSRWGTMRLKLWDCQTGQLEIQGQNVNRTLDLVRLGTVHGGVCNNHPGLVSLPTIGPLPPLVRDSLTGSWFEPATEGQGFTLHHVSAERGMVYFFGYRDDGSDLWLVGTWEEALEAGEVAQISLLEFYRGVESPNQTRSVEWGTLTLRLDDCDSAFARLEGTDGVQSLDLQRLSGAVGLLCR